MRWGLTKKNKVGAVSDEWDRGYNVDFFIKVKDKYIGLQIKPAGYAYITQIINELEFQKKKAIHNPEVIEEIRKEIERLEKE